MLGGVHIPSPQGLQGHSDGDVVLHAVCDAVLGALGAGDIGQHFPDSDERYRGIASGALLRQVAVVMDSAGWRIGNVDITIIAERPRLAPHRDAIRARVAELLGAPASAVSVKAKTNEGLDAVGRGEAVAATAVVLLEAAVPPQADETRRARPSRRPRNDAASSGRTEKPLKSPRTRSG